MAAFFFPSVLPFSQGFWIIQSLTAKKIERLVSRGSRSKYSENWSKAVLSASFDFPGHFFDGVRFNKIVKFDKLNLLKGSITGILLEQLFSSCRRLTGSAIWNFKTLYQV